MKQKRAKNGGWICGEQSSAIYEEESEAQANRLLLKLLLPTLLLFGFLAVWSLLPALGGSGRLAFGAFCFALLLFLLALGVCGNAELSELKIKYFLMSITVMMLAAVETALCVPVWLLNVLPILYCSLYGSRRMRLFTYAASLLGMAGAVGAAWLCGLKEGERLLFELYSLLPRCAVMLLLGMVLNRISGMIGQLVEKNLQSRRIAEADIMTGLYNRNKYMEDCASGRWDKKRIAVFFWDVNDLKHVNDRMGHECGDVLIREIAESISAIMNPRCAGYRIGGDEFVLVLSDASEEEAKLLLACWRQCVETKALASELPLSAAVGYAYGDGGSLAELVREADRAMYRDKAQRKRKNLEFEGVL